MKLRPPSRRSRRMYVRLYLDARYRCRRCRAGRVCRDSFICHEAAMKRLEDR